MPAGFHGGQLRDLNKSTKWKQLGTEAALPPSLAPLCLFPCLSLCPQEKSALRRALTTELLQASPWLLLDCWLLGPKSYFSGFTLKVPIQDFGSLGVALWEQRVM